MQCAVSYGSVLESEMQYFLGCQDTSIPSLFQH